MKTILAAVVTLCIGLNLALAGGDTVALGKLSSKVPEGWKKQEPSNKLRKFQFSVPKAEGDSTDAELVVFSFGASGKEDNLRRWKSQFLAPAGKKIEDVSKVDEFKVGNAEVVLLDISGIYKYKKSPQDPNEKEQLKPEYRRFNVMLTTDKEVFFITLTGPEKTVAQHKDAFDRWLKSFK